MSEHPTAAAPGYCWTHAKHPSLCGCGGPGEVIVSTPCCTVCGKAKQDHGSYPTCASHPYTTTFECGAIGVYSASKGFVGHPCPGAACRDGCVLSTQSKELK